MRKSHAWWRAVFAVALGLVVATPAVAADAFKKRRPRRIRVRRIRPRAGQTFVNPETEIRIVFSRRVDPETIRPDTIQVRRVLGDEVPWTFRMARRNRVVVLVPLTILTPGADHEVRVLSGLQGARGQELARERRAIFYTDPRFAPFQFLRPEQFEVVTGSTMVEGRAAHSALELPDGTVLLAGGQSDFVNISNTADRFLPAEDRFRPVASVMSRRRAYHVCTPIAGAAMLIGGWDGNAALAETEIYDTVQNGFRPGPPLNERRDFVDAVALDDRTILVVGGLNYEGQGAVFSETAEIYEVSTGRFRFTRRPPLQRRAGHKLTLLGDGRVLITGGLSVGTAQAPHAEIFDPVTETFRETKSPPLGRRRLHTATVIASGAVFIADGGNGRMELFDPITERFFAAGGASSVRRTRATATLLPSNEVLLAGGFDERSSGTMILDGMDIYQPAVSSFGRVVRASVVFPEPRAGHTATSLASGSVLFAGGFGSASDQSLDTGIVFTPD